MIIKRGNILLIYKLKNGNKKVILVYDSNYVDR